MNNFNCPSCKYEFEQDFIDGEKEKDFITKGDKKPIRLYLSNSIKIIKHGNDVFDDDNEKVNLYACPKCKTVIIDF